MVNTCHAKYYSKLTSAFRKDYCLKVSLKIYKGIGPAPWRPCSLRYNIYIRPIFYYRNRLHSYSNNTGELLTCNRAALINLTPVDWCNVVLSDDVSINNVTFWRRNDVSFGDVTINNVTLLDEPTKGWMAVEKNAKVVRVAVHWSSVFRKTIISGYV